MLPSKSIFDGAPSAKCETALGRSPATWSMSAVGPSAEKGRRHVGCLPETAQAARVECALDFTACALVSAQVLRAACTDKIGCLLLQTMRTRSPPAEGHIVTQNGPRPLLAYWCEPQEVRTSGESPINDLLDFWPLGRRLGTGRSCSAKPPLEELAESRSQLVNNCRRPARAEWVPRDAAAAGP